MLVIALVGWLCCVCGVLRLVGCVAFVECCVWLVVLREWGVALVGWLCCVSGVLRLVGDVAFVG